MLYPCQQCSSVLSLHEVGDSSDRMFAQEEYMEYGCTASSMLTAIYSL